MRVLLMIAAFGTLNAAAADVAGRLEKVLKKSSIAREALGLAVIDLSDVQQPLLFALNEQRSFTPASVTKLATASAVLQKLGPSFKQQTGLWTSAAIKGTTLVGSLVLKGGGDPGFVSETMWFLVNEFARTGITRIAGDILVDDTDFDSTRADPSRDPERVDRAYDAPVGAMSFNWNSINIFVRPTEVGKPPQVYLDPLTDYFKIENKAKTTGKVGADLDVGRSGSRIVVRGSLGIGHGEVIVYKNIDDPVDWSGRNLIYFLKQRGIAVSGGVKAGRKPNGARLLAKADSKPISQAVSDMLKFSNNYVAEMLTKGLAAQSGVTPATLDAGMQVIRKHLINDVGLKEDAFTLLNPSGLSRKNRISARDLAAILVHAQRSFPNFAEFLSGLPIAGQDGTLKKRMIGSEAEGWVRAKTGHLSGVTTLAGYAGRKDGGLTAFAFIFNGKADQGESARHLFDGLAIELVQ